MSGYLGGTSSPDEDGDKSVQQQVEYVTERRDRCPLCLRSIPIKRRTIGTGTLPPDPLRSPLAFAALMPDIAPWVPIRCHNAREAICPQQKRAASDPLGARFERDFHRILVGILPPPI